MKDLILSVGSANSAFEAAQKAFQSSPCKSNLDSLTIAHTSLRDAVKSLSDSLNQCSNEPAK